MSPGFFGSSTPSTQAGASSFGAAAPSTTPAAGTGFSFGAQFAKPAGTSFSLNPNPAAPAAVSTGFGFGAPVATTGLTFGTPAAATQVSTGFSFGAPSATPQGSAGFGFGAPTATTQAPQAGFGFGSSVAATQASTGFSFGTPAASTQASTGFSFTTPAASTQASTGFSLGAPQAAPQASSGFSLGAPQAAPQASSGFSLGAPQAAATPFVGLGGKQLQLGPGGTIVSTGGLSANFGKADGKPAKETPVPDEVAQTVAAFQKHVQEQKSEYEQISRHSWAPVQRVREEMGALRQLLAAVEASVQRHATAVSKHKHDVCEALKSAEVAQRTSEISPGLQYENTAPQELFERLVQQYEASMVTYQRQIDQLERLLAASDGASFVSPEELMSAIRQLHETFVWLAGHLQTVHEKVQVLKDHYLAYRRSMGADVADVFGGERGKAVPTPPPPQPQPGPSPFAVDRNAAAAAVAQARGEAPPAAASVPATPAAGTSLLGAAASPFTPAGSTGFGASGTLFGSTPAFGLKLDPPPGSKRGKVD